jgi:23S rRNA G2445 N2-methylase RlmL
VYEAEVLPGLEPFAIEELQACSAVSVILGSETGRLCFQASSTSTLSELRRISSIYEVLEFPVPRPKALLGHQYFTSINKVIASILRGSRGAFFTLSLDAAGSDSSVMQRLIQELAAQNGLSVSPDKGDLHLRIRPDRKKTGWQVLVRLTPRPLSTRAWRVANFPGALNAPVASVMASLAGVAASNVVVNLCSGSGTLMIEAAELGNPAAIFGIDNDATVLALARENLTAAHVGRNVRQVHADATALPLATASVDTLLADLPFGQHVGSHQDNMTLYPALLAEAARVARPSALFALLTHEKRLIEHTLRTQKAWITIKTVEINLNGLHPRLLLLRRHD